MPENKTVNLLLSLHGTSGLQCLVALWAIGPLPVTTSAVSEAVGESYASVIRGLRRLRLLGLVVCDEVGGKETNWRLAPPAVQLPLPLDLLDEPKSWVSDDVEHPLKAATALALPPAHPSGATQPALAQLQAGDPADDGASHQASGECDDTSQKPKSLTSQKPKSNRAGIIISFKSQESNDSINNNNTRTEATSQKPKSLDSPPAEHVFHNPQVGAPDSESRAAEKKPRHIADVIRALRRRGQPALADDPFPPDLRHCVERLIAIHCTRKRAELAVARSPFDAPTILAEIARWKARKASPEGSSITLSGFPFLVAARIESGDHCPVELPRGCPSGEYEIEPEPVPEESIQPEMPTDVPDEPPSFISLEQPKPAPNAPSSEAVQWWGDALEKLSLEMPKGVFETWLSGAQLIGYPADSHTFTIGLPTAHQRDWVANRLLFAIKRVLHDLTGRPVEVCFVVSDHAHPS